jgi:AraC-like DNA-binding protein
MTRRVRRTGNPRGRPFKLTPEIAARVYAAYSATRRGQRIHTLETWADQFGVSVRTLERLVDRLGKQHLADIVGRRFTETDINAHEATP